MTIDGWIGYMFVVMSRETKQNSCGSGVRDYVTTTANHTSLQVGPKLIQLQNCSQTSELIEKKRERVFAYSEETGQLKDCFMLQNLPSIQAYSQPAKRKMQTTISFSRNRQRGDAQIVNMSK